MITKDTAYQNITQLVERFDEQKESYKKSDYNETLVRRDFIDPFFKSLGWDIDNSQGYAEAYREVIHEDRVKIGSATKAPDYSFRLPGGKRLFFVEAKKPSVLVKNEIMPAYQVRRYAWSAKLPVSILTDFEEFALYDCNKKPKPDDKASTGRIKYLTYTDYLKEFDFIWDTFSKERVLKGSFDKFVASDVGKKGTTTVDKDFLASLDEWRIQLAQNIALRNPLFNEDELNYAVQQTIDRIIFLRIAEDRGVEEYGRLKTALKGENYYTNLFHLFKEADEKYNSGLFDFKKDKLSASLQLDNKVLKGIFNELYYPVSPYEFSVLSVEILGSAYEQFLGKQIKLTDKHKASIEEKPEVRKAGGVYYTPQYIVDYIVEQTIGKKLEELTKQFESSKASPVEGGVVGAVAKIKIVDPACGSGSFLIGAYQRLLTWHQQYYKPKFDELSAIAGSNDYTNKQRNDAIKERNKLPLTPDGALTSALKKQILLNNIYGVDIDTQAVEVTKLSLLLKCMEGETQSSINAEMRFGERILPTLDSNIKSGNSLIDLDFYDGEFDFEPGAEKKIKPFSWEKAFPEVFKNGGFDAVIGNPPYVRQEMLGDIKPYLQKRYKVYHGMADLYSYFIERGIGLLKEDGLFGIIVANKWMRANYGEPLRKWFKRQKLEQIIDFGDLPVFQGATTYPCIVISSKGTNAHQLKDHKLITTNFTTLDFTSIEKYKNENSKQILFDALEDEGWNLSGEGEQKLFKRLQTVGFTLGEYVKGEVYRGVLTGLNEAFIIDEEIKNRIIRQDKKSAEIIKNFLAGKDIKRFNPPSGKSYLILFPKGFTNSKGNNPKDAWKWLQENYPGIANHLQQYKEKAMKRFDKGEYWWELRACDYYDEFEREKIMLPDIALRMQATFDDRKYYCVNTAYIIPTNDKVLLAILNSNLIQFIYTKISSSIRGGYLRFIRQYLQTLPIAKANGMQEKEIIQLVDAMLSLHKEKQQTTLPEKLESLQHRINHTDEKINQLVYQLYGLTEEEIKIVENS
ncbi:MAG: Eco57I restriction-modification methylase domain-containing protein [Flavisolibacter sp.]